MVRDVVSLLERALLLCGVCLALLLLATHSLGCAPLRTNQGRTVQLDPDVDDDLGGTGIESGDIRGASERVARRLLALDHDTRSPRIALLPVTNVSRFRIDPALLRNKLTHEIVNRSKGRFALIPVDGDPARARDIDYVLKTEVRSFVKTPDDLDAYSDYVQYSFVLERASDGEAVFSEMYETKRLSSVDVVYQ